jgi:hypothetical protein
MYLRYLLFLEDLQVQFLQMCLKYLMYHLYPTIPKNQMYPRYHLNLKYLMNLSYLRNQNCPSCLMNH